MTGRAIFARPQLPCGLPGPAWPQRAVYQHQASLRHLHGLVDIGPELLGGIGDQRRESGNHARDHALRNTEYIADNFLRDILPVIHQRDRDRLSQGEFLRAAGSLNPGLGQDVLDTHMEFFELFGVQPESTLVAQRLLLAAKVV